MNQNIAQTHNVNDEGNPAGGRSTGIGIDINWQDGPLREESTEVGTPSNEIAKQNGAFVEGVISAAIGRLEFYQASKFRCRENALALTKLQESVHWLNARTADREAQGIEGTHGRRASEG